MGRTFQAEGKANGRVCGRDEIGKFECRHEANVAGREGARGQVVEDEVTEGAGEPGHGALHRPW